MLEYYCYIFTFIITFNDFFQFNNLLLDEYFKKLIIRLHCLFVVRTPYVLQYIKINREFKQSYLYLNLKFLKFKEKKNLKFFVSKII